MSYGHGPDLAGARESGPMTPAEQARRVESERGRKARAARQAKLEYQLDPDGTLAPEELARRVHEYNAELGRRAGKVSKARRAGSGLGSNAADPRPAPVQAVRLPEPTEREVPGTVVRSRVGEPTLPLPIETWDRPELSAVLTARDIGALYRALQALGVTQRQIAQSAGQGQSEVSEILGGRQVRDVLVLERIADGLGIPRERMRLTGDASTYPGQVTVANPPEGDDMLRRRFEHLFALSATSAVGALVPGLGELAGWLTSPDLPTGARRIGASDVALIRHCGEQVGTLARTQGGHGEAAVRLAEWADKWLDAECSDVVRAELLVTLAHIHTVTAWCCHDVGAVARAYWHFARAVELATQAGDAYQAAYAMRHAAMMLGQLDVAEAMAATAAQTFAVSGDRREGVLADMALARLHVRAGDPRGPLLARSALEAVGKTGSAVARQSWLPGLVSALEARPGGDYQELARMARQVANV